MYRVKIYGAGSIGNHLAHAAKQLGWHVAVCDINAAALERMKTDIYPRRYGEWDDSIELFESKSVPKGNWDLILIGTPPDTHMPLAIDALAERPRGILIEKPVCPPTLEGANELFEAAQKTSTRVFVGFDHVVGEAALLVEKLIAEDAVGPIETIDVEFREHWAGIFAAHPWLTGPSDSYLGFWQRGGGASGEHSHAINLFQHFAHTIRAGRVLQVNARLKYETKGSANYDSMCFLELETANGMIGRVVQDVVTIPSRKRAIMQGERGTIEWVCNYDKRGDAVIVKAPHGSERVEVVQKRRPDDFIQELRFLQAQLDGGSSPALDLSRGLDSMLVLAAAHLSERTKRRVVIDYTKCYKATALELA